MWASPAMSCLGGPKAGACKEVYPRRHYDFTWRKVALRVAPCAANDLSEILMPPLFMIYETVGPSSSDCVHLACNLRFSESQPSLSAKAPHRDRARFRVRFTSCRFAKLQHWPFYVR